MNSTNPYESPSTDQGKEINDNDKVRRVAAAQRLVLMAVLAGILVNVFSYIARGQDVAIQMVFLVIAIAAVVFMIYAMFNLAKELNSVGMAVFYAILMIVPCVSLIMLLVVNQQATGYLTAKGIKVGLMGADMGQFK